MPRVIACLRALARCSPPHQPAHRQVDVPMIHDGGIDCLAWSRDADRHSFGLMTGSSKCYHARTATVTHARMLRRTVALALLVLPWDLAAQVGSELMDDQPTEESMAVIGPVPLVSLFPAFGAGAQGPPTLSETGWLSAAIEELRLSPFHATESALHLGTLTPIGIGAPNGLRIPMEAYSPGSIQSASALYR